MSQRFEECGCEQQRLRLWQEVKLLQNLSDLAIAYLLGNDILIKIEVHQNGY